MDLKTSLLLLVTVTFATEPLLADDVCPYEKCTCSGDTIACFGSTYETLPPPRNTTGVYKYFSTMSDTLTTIPDHSLVKNLSYIKFKFTPIANIGPHAFDDSATTLDFLELWSPAFTKIPDTFGSLQVLSTFHMSDGPISDWNEDAFAQVGKSLNEIMLARCRLTSWPTWMHSFTNLSTLQFSTEVIKTMPDDAFEHLEHTLTKLELTDIKLSQIPASLSKLNKLEQLFLDQNNLRELTNLPQEAKLTSLSLTMNQFSDTDQLVKMLIPYSKTLNALLLSGNKFTIPPDLFTMSSLRILDLDANYISDPPVGYLPPSIEMLYLRYNKLTRIPADIFAMPNLKDLLVSNNAIRDVKNHSIPPSLPELDLSNNLVTVLKDNIFPVNSSLKELDFSSNPISDISSMAFANLPVLETLTLSNTSLSRVPLALLQLSGLQELHMERTPNLRCTCQEKALVPWFEDHPNLLVYGTCGNDTISHYFRVEAKKCPHT